MLLAKLNESKSLNKQAVSCLSALMFAFFFVGMASLASFAIYAQEIPTVKGYIAEEVIADNADIETVEKASVEKNNAEKDSTKQAVPQVGKHVTAANSSGLNMLLSLLMVLAVIVFAAWLLKSFKLGSQQIQGMKVISSLHLGTKERLVVVEVNDKQLLLGVTAHNIRVLDTLDNPLQVGQSLSAANLGQNIISLLKKQK